MFSASSAVNECSRIKLVSLRMAGVGTRWLVLAGAILALNAPALHFVAFVALGEWKGLFERPVTGGGNPSSR